MEVGMEVGRVKDGKVVKIIYLRRWNWLPWFMKKVYVPMPDHVRPGQILPLCNSFYEALKWLS